MSANNPTPTPRYRIEFAGHAQTWEELERIIGEMQIEVALRRAPGPMHVVSGGGWHVTVTEPDPTQTPERWTRELLEWRERERGGA